MHVVVFTGTVFGFDLVSCIIEAWCWHHLRVLVALAWVAKQRLESIGNLFICEFFWSAEMLWGFYLILGGIWTVIFSVVPLAEYAAAGGRVRTLKELLCRSFLEVACVKAVLSTIPFTNSQLWDVCHVKGLDWGQQILGNR